MPLSVARGALPVRLLVLASAFAFVGCSAMMVGATNRKAHGRLLLVRPEQPDDFGRRRLEYLAGYFTAVGKFIEAQPARAKPEMIRSFLDEQHRAALLLFYIQRNKVYTFVDIERKAGKMELVAERAVTEAEMAEYARLRNSGGPP